MIVLQKLPGIILDLFGVKPEERDQHTWEVRVRVAELDDGRLRRFVTVVHQGEVVSESKSRPWSR